jgi:hypothetical protein
MTEPLAWRKSSFSGAQSSCVEMCRTAEGRILLRNSNHPDAGTLASTATELEAFLAGVAAGEFDNLV